MRTTFQKNPGSRTLPQTRFSYCAKVNAAVLLKALPPHLRNLMVTRNSANVTGGSGSAAAARAAFNRQAQNTNLQANFLPHIPNISPVDPYSRECC